jgi:hypothetical protein
MPSWSLLFSKGEAGQHSERRLATGLDWEPVALAKQSPHDHLVPYPQFRPWPIERLVNILNELAARGEPNAIVPTHKPEERITRALEP